MWMGNVVFEVILISQEKGSLQVYGNKETWPLSAATVIYV